MNWLVSYQEPFEAWKYFKIQVHIKKLFKSVYHICSTTNVWQLKGIACSHQVLRIHIHHMYIYVKQQTISKMKKVDMCTCLYSFKQYLRNFKILKYHFIYIQAKPRKCLVILRQTVKKILSLGGHNFIWCPDQAME